MNSGSQEVSGSIPLISTTKTTRWASGSKEAAADEEK